MKPPPDRRSADGDPVTPGGGPIESPSTDGLLDAVAETARPVPPPPTPSPPIVQQVAARIGSSARRTRAEPGPAPQIDGYEILEPLGRGGMGVVYRARQLTPPRLVALKTLLTGAHASPEELQRFKTEIEAVAALDHPNIVPIFAVGEQGGCAYFSMELVTGGSLREKLAVSPLTPRAAARLVTTCARAVHFAHERGVVHRDLKPANILLASVGNADGILLDSGNRHTHYLPKITDFGLAKRVGRVFNPSANEAPSIERADAPPSELTSTGQILGTPSYMAPEQASGEAGCAADIYALGAILYESLTGRPPFRGVTPLETLRQLQDQEPAAPRALQPGTPRDLQTICLKCLDKEPHDRYPTAAALADDLDRYLTGRPIVARPVSSWERALKWARRRPAVAALALVSLAAGVVLAVGGWWTSAQLQALAERLRLAALTAARHAAVAQEERDEARRREEEANRLRAEADAQRRRAEANLDQARRVVDDLVTRLSEDPRLRAHNLDDLRRELLRSALGYYQEFIRNNKENLLVRAELGRAHNRLAEITSELGDKNDAIELYREAISIFSELVKRHNEPAFLSDLARSHQGLGRIFVSTNRSLAAAPLREAQSIQERLVKDHPDNADYQLDLAATSRTLGVLYRDTIRFREAEPELTKSLELQLDLAKRQPPNDKLMVELCRTYRHLGWLYRLTERVAKGREAHHAALTLAEKLCAAHPGQPLYERELGFCHWAIGNLELSDGDLETANRAYTAATAVQERLYLRHPEVPAYRIDFALSCHGLSKIHREQGKLDVALTWSTRAVDIMESAREMEPENARATKLQTEILLYRSEIDDRMGRTADSERDRDKAFALDAVRSRVNDVLRAEVLARKGEHTIADRKARAVAEAKQVTAGRLALLVRVYALCATAAAKDEGLPESERDRRAQEYAERAVELARRAKAAGAYQNRAAAENLATNPDLDVLRGRADFQELLRAAPD